MEIDVVIPARSGSKSIPHKNIQLLNGKRLIFHTFDFILGVNGIRNIYFTTDSDMYINLVKENYPNETKIRYIQRPETLAMDDTTDYEVFQHVIEDIQKRYGYSSLPTCFLHLRPTFPIRKRKDLEDMFSIWKMVYNQYDSMRSVIPTDILPQKMYWITKPNPLYGVKYELIPYFHRWEGIKEPYNEARQKFPSAYIHNGCYDIVKVSTILRKRSMTGESILPYEMKEEDDYDIDTEKDWRNVENGLAK
jgi:CMP-N-acetylneuraminic acid synthetase